MAKEIEYPRAALKRSLDLAQAAYELGGSSTAEMCAHKLNKKLGGSFTALVSGAAKYGLVTRNKGQISTTQLYKDYKLAYSEDEAINVLRKAFFNVPLFEKIFERFQSQKLPLEILDKLLIREFRVNENIASRVASYFVNGAKATGILASDNTIVSLNDPHGQDNIEQDGEGNNEIDLPSITVVESQRGNEFSVTITGPGMNSAVVISDEDDLLIVDLMLKKIKKKISENLETE